MKQDRNVHTSTRIPIPLFLPLVKSCFDENAEAKDLPDLITPYFLSAYSEFRDFLMLGNFFAAKTTSGRCTNMIYSEQDLLPYKRDIHSCRKNFLLSISIPYHLAEKVRRTCLDGKTEEYIRNTEENVIFMHINEDALAYFYWCMMRIDEGKRIGTVKWTNRTADFCELGMQEYFPRYNEKKAYCIDEEDFLFNAPMEDIQEEFLGLLSCFRKKMAENKNDQCLPAIEKHIRRYSERIWWNPDKFFGNLGWKK